MRPCWMVYQLLLFSVVNGETNEDYFGNLGYRSDQTENHFVATDFHKEFDPSSVLAFVPARSCHLQFSKDHGTFSPPVFYGYRHVNLWCNWTILAAPGKHIVIYITGFKTNKTCNENHDEIIFEGISSSVENTIVYACWNKPTHVFATEASAVSVVLFWRSFSNIGSKRYFDGRYYVFDDPVLGPNANSGNCSLASKQNISTSDVTQAPIPDESLTSKSNLHSVFPKSSFSKIISSSIPSPEVHPQEPPVVMQTYRPTPTIDHTIDHQLTETTHEDDMLRVSRTLPQSFSTMYNTFKSQLPAVGESLEFGVHEAHKVTPIAGDLEPSHVGKWETMLQSVWTSHSEFQFETPSLISTIYTRFLDAASSRMQETQPFTRDQSASVLTHSLITPLAGSMYVSTIYGTKLHSTAETSPYFVIDSPTRSSKTPQFSTAHTVKYEALYSKKVNVPESQHLSGTDFTEPHREPNFIIAHATKPPELSLIHTLHTDFPEPSLLSDIFYPSKIHTTKISELGIDQSSEQVNIPNFSIAQALGPSTTLNVQEANSLDLPQSMSFSLTRYIEPTLSSVETVHYIGFEKSKPLNVTVNFGTFQSSVFSVTDRTTSQESAHFSVDRTIGQFVLNTADNAHLLMPFTKLPLSINVESHPKEFVSWQEAFSGFTPYPDSFKNLHSQSASFTETHTSVLHGHVSHLQVSEQPFLQNYGTVHPPFTPTKSLNNEILDKNNTAGPGGVESYTTSRVAPFSTAPYISSRIKTSVLGSQMVHSTHWTMVEQPLDPSSPKSTLVTPDQQLMHESTMASYPTPEIATELIYYKSALQLTENTDNLVTGSKYISGKSLETWNLPTIDYNVARSLVESRKELDWLTIKDHLEATDATSRIFTHPVSTPVLYFKPSDNPESNMDIIPKELINEGNEKSTYSYQTYSDLSLHQNAVGQPRAGILDEEDETYLFGNQSDFEVSHEPGDSLFVISTEMEHKDAVFKGSEKDLVQSVTEKITERMIYFPGGVNLLILREIRWTNVNRVILTFWIKLNKGGKEMGNFLKTQLKALEGYPFGSSNATLVSFTVEDVNECQLGLQKCHSNANCVNIVGSYSCSCMDGYEDHSPGIAPGTLCIASKPVETHSLSQHLEILIGAIVTVAVTLLLVIIILCVVQQKRRAKANFSLQDPPAREHGAHLGGDRHAEIGQPLSSPTRHLSPRHGREHHTARETSSTLELTRITIEQAAC